MFKQAGTVVITGTTRSGVKNSFTLHIINGDADGDIGDFAFAQETMTLKPGEYGQNVITFTPADEPFSTSMTYTSSDNDVATVNEMGVVEAKKEGICTITAEEYWSDIGKSYTLIVSQDEAPPDQVITKYKISYDLNGGTLDGETGIITVEAEEGSTITIPDAPTREGYSFTYWEGSEYHPGDSYEVTGDHTFTAQWEKEESASGDESASDDESPDDDTNSGSRKADIVSENSYPKSGDENNLILWESLMGTALLGLFTLFFLKRRNRKTKL